MHPNWKFSSWIDVSQLLYDNIMICEHQVMSIIEWSQYCDQQSLATCQQNFFETAAVFKLEQFDKVGKEILKQ